MVDENEYRRSCRQINAEPCVFQRAILRRCGGCDQARRLNIAEREAVAYRSRVARIACARFLELMRGKSAFAVAPVEAGAPLAFGKEIKIQCGGILGLQKILGNRRDGISLLLQAATGRYGKTDELPFELIVREVHAFRTRQRRGPG